MSTKDEKNSNDDLNSEVEYDEDGNVVKFRISREKLFRNKWDTVIKVNFYSKQHVQRLSMAFDQCLGEQGKDWDTFVPGFARVSDLIKYNRSVLDDEGRTLEELRPQYLLLGIKDDPINDMEELDYRLKRLKIKYIGDRI